MRFRTHAAAGALAGLVALGACFGRPTYGCEDAAQCVVGDVEGFCEDDGLCSYLDDTCPSGRRYSPYAGARAEMCVDEGAGSTADTGTIATSTTTTSADDGGGSTTGSASSATDGSGTECTSDCPEPGAQLWSARAVELGAGRGRGVAIGRAGVGVTGEVAVEDRIELVVATFDPQGGGVVGSLPWPAVAGGPDRGMAIASLSNGELVAVGSETTEAGHERGVIVRVDASAAAVWTRRWDTLADDALAGVAVDTAGRIVAVGSSATRAIVLTYEDDGEEVQSRVFDPPAGAASASLHAAAAAGGAGAWVAGAVELAADSSDGWARRLNADGGIVLEVRIDDPSQSADIASAVASVPSGDTVLGGMLAGNAWLSRIDADGALAFSRAVQDGGSIRGLAVTPEGTTIAVGHTDAGDHRDAWIAAFDADGELVWDESHDTAAMDDEALGVALEGGVAYVTGYGTDPEGEAIWVAAYAL